MSILQEILESLSVNEFIYLLAPLASVFAAALSTPSMAKGIRKAILGQKDDSSLEKQLLSQNKGGKETKTITDDYSSRKATISELREKRDTDNLFKKVSFGLLAAMSIIGTFILFVGIMLCLFTDKSVGWITTASGAIIELVAGIYFWLVNRTMAEVKENSKQLEKAEDLLTAMELISKIGDEKLRDDTYRAIIEKLIT